MRQICELPPKLTEFEAASLQTLYAQVCRERTALLKERDLLRVERDQQFALKDMYHDRLAKIAEENGRLRLEIARLQALVGEAP